MTSRFRLASLSIFLATCSCLAFGQQASQIHPRARITERIDENRLVVLPGNTHPLARAKFDAGVVRDSTPMSRMLLLLSRSPEQETALEKLLDDQQTPGSAHYRQWLTPEEFGKRFGPAEADVQTVTSWLQSHGFSVDHVSAAKNVIEFSGSAGQVRQAFHTPIHEYSIGGTMRMANARDPEIPAALAPVVKGITSLNNFPRKPAAHLFGQFHRDLTTGEVIPDYTVSNGTSTYYALGPADFATIYNTQSLQQTGINGRGRTIAVIGDSNINLQDVTDFRNMFGLGSGNTSVVIDGPDPGIIAGGAEFEALLDVEWANAAAPGANVVLVSASDTSASSGLDLASLHVIDNNMADLLGVSFGYCEESLGSAENQFIQNLWQQASAQGITVLVSTGDSGSASCDDFNTATMAQSGLAVNGIASTPFNVAVGGTDFQYNGHPTLYWSTTNGTSTLLSAKSYIPESTWNISCASTATAANLSVCPAAGTGTPPSSLNIVAGSGGASSCSTVSGSACQGTPKPVWQSGTGVPADGVRDLPDVSLFSAVSSLSDTFYVVCNADAMQGNPSCQNNGGSLYFLAAGGTSVATPAFAGILALAEQKTGTRLGNVNYLLYSLAAQPGSSCTSATSEAASCIFNDVVNGNIAVPCAAGSPNCSVTSGSATGVLIDNAGNPAYTTQAGYDLATGLGSVNGGHLVNAIASGIAGFTPTTTSLTLNGATTQVSAKHGDPISVAVSVTPNTATGSVALISPSGGIQGNVLSGGLANWSSRLFPGGNYSVTAHYQGDGTRGASDSNGVPVSISPEASQTFVNLIAYDTNGNLISDTATTAAYGSPYLLRIDVGDWAATVSSTQGVSSNCSNGATSCATGTVTLTSNGAPLDGGSFPLNNRGNAEDWAIQLSPGTYNVVASYPGDPSYTASSGSTNLTITTAPTTTTVTIASTVQYGSDPNFSATASAYSSGAPMTGSMNFLLDGQNLPVGGTEGANSPDSTHRAFSSFTNGFFNSVGTHTLAAQYTGDVNYAASTSDPVTFTVTQASTDLQLSLSPNPGVPRSPVTLRVYIHSNSIYGAGPTGTVTFYDNGVSIGTAAASGSYYATATLSYTFTQLGNHTITASYGGDTNYLGSSSAPTQLAIQNQISSFGVGLNSALNPTVVNYPTQLQASFSSNQNYAPPLTGSVTFSDNGSPLTGTVSYATSNGLSVATLNYAFTTTGAHNITAAYSGDVNYTPSATIALALTVVSQLQPIVSPPGYSTPNGVVTINNPITLFGNILSVSNGPAPTGSISFLDNGTALGSPVTLTSNQYSLQASTVVNFTTTGTHVITFQYSGDANYSAALSQPPLQLPVEGPLWVRLDATQGLFSSTGGSGSLGLWVDNNTATSNTVTLTCTSDSPKATCTLQNSSVTISAYGNSFQNVSFLVPAITGRVRHMPSLWTRTSGLLFCGVFIGAGLLDRRRRKLLTAMIVVFFLTALLSCGGGGGGSNSGLSNPGGGSTTPSTATYHFTITATGTSGNTSSQVYTATVQ